MKLIWIMSMVLTIGTQGLQAQTESKKDKLDDKYSNEEIAWAKERTEMLDQMVKLDANQTEEIMKINLKYADRYDKMRSESTNDKQWTDYRDNTFEKRVRKYHDVLNPQQSEVLKTKYNNLKDSEVEKDKPVREKAVKALER